MLACGFYSATNTPEVSIPVPCGANIGQFRQKAATRQNVGNISFYT